MKVYISADIEGVAGVTNWDETEIYHSAHSQAAIQMTKEVLAACRGAIAAGATEIVVKDGHDSARNIIYDEMPEEVTLIRGWTNSPESMVAGIDESFDAVIYIGYHSGAGFNGNPLSHTMNLDNNYVKINRKAIGEFEMNTYMAAHVGVPAVFISGDAQLCEKAKELVPAIETVAVKSGTGNATFNMNSTKACRLIEEGVRKGLEKLEECKIQEPQSYELEVNFKEAVKAYRASFYPGAEQINYTTVRYVAKDAFEMMTAKIFIL